MRLVLASLTAPSGDPPRQETLAVLTDLLWAHAVPADGLEHVKARYTHDGLDLYLFVRAPTDDVALPRMRRLLDRVSHAIAAQGYVLTGAR
ncbi:hypothetical protein AB0G79_13255 [Streptomyces sp. NPDC020807]|uniref:hypothetical protein n=1 Tax=Streptomyces sp. NPDC020807 TaxID=3155119 RepID=UPI0033CAECD7